MACGLKPSFTLKILYMPNCLLNFNMASLMRRLHPLKQDKNMKVYEVTSAVQKPLTPDQARVKSMQAQAKRAQQAVKAERARQKIKAGQAQLAKII